MIALTVGSPPPSGPPPAAPDELMSVVIMPAGHAEIDLPGEARQADRAAPRERSRFRRGGELLRTRRGRGDRNHVHRNAGFVNLGRVAAAGRAPHQAADLAGAPTWSACRAPHGRDSRTPSCAPPPAAPPAWWTTAGSPRTGGVLKSSSSPLRIVSAATPLPLRSPGGATPIRIMPASFGDVPSSSSSARRAAVTSASASASAANPAGGSNSGGESVSCVRSVTSTDELRELLAGGVERGDRVGEGKAGDLDPRVLFDARIVARAGGLDGRAHRLCAGALLQLRDVGEPAVGFDASLLLVAGLWAWARSW